MNLLSPLPINMRTTMRMSLGIGLCLVGMCGSSGLVSARAQSPQTRPGAAPASAPQTKEAASATSTPGTAAPPAFPTVKYPLSAVTALAFSPDGRQVALGDYCQVVVYDAADWKPGPVFTQAVDAVRSLTFSPDGHILAIGCGLPARNGEALLWDLSAGNSPRALKGQGDAIETIAFSQDGKRLLLGSDDNTLRYYDDLSGDHFVKLDEHNGRVQAAAFAPQDGGVFVTGAMDRLVKVWDSRTGHTVINFDQSENGITGLEFLPGGDQFVGASLDGKLYWWGIRHDARKDVYTGYLARATMAHPDGVYALNISHDGKRLITCGADDAVSVWSSDGRLVCTFKDATQPIYAVALSPDGKLAAGGGRSGVLYVWDVEGDRLLDIIAPPALPGTDRPVAKPKAAPSKTTVRKQRS